MELLEPTACQHPVAGNDAAAFVLSRLPHPDKASAFVDAGTGGSLSFAGLRRGALSLATGLRLGLGLRRGDAVLVLAPNSLLLPQIVLGVLAAGGVVVAADPDATAAEVSAAARGSGAAIVVAAPEAAGNAAGAGVPVLLTTRSLDPDTLSAEELIDGADPTMAPEEAARASDVAFVAYSSTAAGTKTVAMTHADLIAAATDVGSPAEEGRRVCLASLPMCSLYGLPLLALGLPAAGATTVLVAPPSDPRAAREAVAVHGATDVVATPEAAAVLAAAMPQDGGKLSSLRRVIAAPVPLAAEARLEFRRRLPWVELTELFAGTPEKETMPATQEVQMELRAPVVTQTHPTVIQNNSPRADQSSTTRIEATTPVPTLKKMQKIILGDIFSRSNMSKYLTRKDPETCITQATSKL